ncbi:MAG: septal ring lytic transglycosylase RlpA family protein [Thiohalomonadaceae bacterium]
MADAAMSRRAGGCILVLAMLVAGCGEFPVRDGGPNRPVDLSGVPDATPRWEPRSRYGNPPEYTVNGRTYRVMESAAGYVEQGLASWYGTKFHGQYTSSREIYDMYGMTAAHRSLPLPTYVRVTNLQNGRSVVVKVNDRGPFHEDRIIDLSYAAAHKLGIVSNGVARVEVRALDPVGPGGAPVTAAVVTAQPGFRADEAAPVPVPLPAPAPVATTSAPGAATLYVQVGAFASRESAERLRSELAGRENLPAALDETPHADHGVLYRVRLGPLPTAEEAERLRERIAGLGLGTPRVVKEPPRPATP